MIRELVGMISITDPRISGKVIHNLVDIVFITICGVISGANSWDAIEEWGNIKYEWLKKYLELPNGIPSHDTFNRVFSIIKEKELAEIFIKWTEKIKGNFSLLEVIAIDGKTIRGSKGGNDFKSKVHLVSAWGTENSMVFGQVKVSDKSNEITAIPELLDKLKIKDSIITIDAMGTQKNIAEKIIKLEADYVLALKNNHKNMYEDVSFFFEEELKTNKEIFSVSSTLEKGHGRIEKRTCYVTNNIDWLSQKSEWSKLTTLIMIKSTREIKGEKSTETRFYISSLNKEASYLLDVVRKHWGIENSLHWCLDVGFNEDRSRIRAGNASENIAVVRKIALNLLKKENSFKGGIERKRNKAGWDEKYLEKVIFG